ncbi:DNA cytosine methyltransferase [Staphylococcus pseudintermedius]
MKKTWNTIDLFCGAGGLSQGFLQAGYNVVLGVDFDEPALKTYAHNIEGAKTLKADLFDEVNSIKNIEKITNNNIDIIIAGPPCQGKPNSMILQNKLTYSNANKIMINPPMIRNKSLRY